VGAERLADPDGLAALLRSDPAAATAELAGSVPLLLLLLLRRSIGAPTDVRVCARMLLDAGADPDSHTIEWGGEGRMTALFDAVERRDSALVRLLIQRDATKDEDAFYHACEQSDLVMLELLYQPEFRHVVNHKLEWTSKTSPGCVGSSIGISTSTPTAACTMRSAADVA